MADSIADILGNHFTPLGRYSLVRKATRYGLDGQRIEPRLVTRFSTPVQIGPVAYPVPLYNGYRIFPGGKAAGAWL
jgi:hypothetical protein